MKWFWWVAVCCWGLSGSAREAGDVKVRGFRLSKVDAKSVYEEAGLRRGDIIVSLDGVPVTSENELLKLPKHLAQNKRVTLRIERAGKIIILKYRRVN